MAERLMELREGSPLNARPMPQTRLRRLRAAAVRMEVEEG